jgi:hypothetical protein
MKRVTPLRLQRGRAENCSLSHCLYLLLATSAFSPIGIVMLARQTALLEWDEGLIEKIPIDMRKAHVFLRLVLQKI